MIACRGVAAGYGRRDVLRGVSLALVPGRLTALMGPNGSGKSTLLRCLARLLPPRRGTVTLEGRSLYGGASPREAARRVALVQQDERLAYPISVREAVQLGRTPHVGRFGWLGPEDRRAVDRALRAMDLTGLADRMTDRLSGGEGKRVQIARALAQEADILLLDEPAAHLDIGHSLELFAILGGLVQRGRTVVVATHELWLLSRYFPEALLMDRGRLVDRGAPRRVLAGAACRRAFGVTFAAAGHGAPGPSPVPGRGRRRASRRRGIIRRG